MIRQFKDFTPSIGKRVFVDEQATVIGDVSLGDDVSVWPQSVIRGDINPITIGERTNIQDGSIVHVTHKSQYSEGYQCHIGADVTIGHGCIIHACTIEDMALVGMGSVILDGNIISKKVKNPTDFLRIVLMQKKKQNTSLPKVNIKQHLNVKSDINKIRNIICG